VRIALTHGSYQGRSLSAANERQVNLYLEKNPDDSPFPYTAYDTPGLTVLSTPTAGTGRGLYTATNGNLYAVVGNSLYYVDSSWTHHLLGTLTYPGGQVPSTPVSMSDNGLVLVCVDGTANGYVVTLSGDTWNGVISDAAFYGADRVDFVDTYFLFNRPGTAQFYVSPSNYAFGTAFNPLWIASKTGSTDPIQGVCVMHLEPWLIGTLTSETWFDSGASDFPFQREPGIYVEHGCAAKYTIAKQDNSIYCVGQDRQGQRMVLEFSGYQAKRISNYALEAVLSKYATVADAIGWTYQQQGHTFYVLTFPSADETWVYDVSTGLWHQRAWMDSNGILHRHRMGSLAAAYGVIVCQDWQTGQLYQLDLNNYTDAGNPILRLQTFPHLRDDTKRVSYSQFVADMEVGTTSNTALVSDPSAPITWTEGQGTVVFTGAGPITFYGSHAYEPAVSLRWSDDGGYTWGQPVMRGLGAQGKTNRTPTWWRTGMARRRLYELSWSFPYQTALNGAYIEADTAET
jgi:hypothetical protein